MLENDELAVDAVASIEKQKITLEHIVDLGHCLELSALRIIQHEKILEDEYKYYKELAEKELPEGMQQLGLKNFTLSNGSSIKIEDIVAVKIDENNREAAHAWLREKGHGDLIKNEVTVCFGKGEDKQAAWLANNVTAIIHDEGPIPGQGAGIVTKKENIHYQTLRAFVCEHLKTGQEFPAEIFKLYIGQIAKLQQLKKKP